MQPLQHNIDQVGHDFHHMGRIPHTRFLSRPFSQHIHEIWWENMIWCIIVFNHHHFSLYPVQLLGGEKNTLLFLYRVDTTPIYAVLGTPALKSVMRCSFVAIFLNSPAVEYSTRTSRTSGFLFEIKSSILYNGRLYTRSLKDLKHTKVCINEISTRWQGRHQGVGSKIRITQTDAARQTHQWVSEWVCQIPDASYNIMFYHPFDDVSFFNAKLVA